MNFHPRHDRYHNIHGEGHAVMASGQRALERSMFARTTPKVGAGSNARRFKSGLS